MAQKRFSAAIEEDLLERLRATVVGLQRQGQQVTLASSLGNAIKAWCVETEAAHNHGHRWPPPGDVELRRGRRLT